MTTPQNHTFEQVDADRPAAFRPMQLLSMILVSTCMWVAIIYVAYQTIPAMLPLLRTMLISIGDLI